MRWLLLLIVGTRASIGLFTRQVQTHPVLSIIEYTNLAFGGKFNTHPLKSDFDGLALKRAKDHTRRTRGMVSRDSSAPLFGSACQRPEVIPACDMLHTATTTGDLDQVQSLLSHGVDANAASTFGMTALHIAAMVGQAAVVPLLMESGAQIDKRAKDGSTPLHIACQENNADVVAILLRHGANTDLVTAHGHRPYDRIDDVDEAGDIIAMLDARGAGQHPQPGKLLRPEFQDYTADFHRARQVAMAAPFAKMHRKARCDTCERKDPPASVVLNSMLGPKKSMSTSTTANIQHAPRHKSIFIGTSGDESPAHKALASAAL